VEQNMKNLVSTHIIEKDDNGDALLTWSYPESDPELQQILLDRSGLLQETIPLQYSFSKYKGTWIYIYIHIKAQKEVLPMVSAFAICFVTTDYNPEKYADLCKLEANIYGNTGDPLKILESFISVFVKGAFNGGEFGTFSSSEHDPRKALLASSIKDVVKMFGQEIILVWSALIMKKRIILHSDKLGILLKTIRVLPLFVWHRQNWELLRPFMTISDAELNDLKTSGVYCAGFLDESIRERDDLYDILVDISNRSITVANHAKADFQMTTIHKDICDFLMSQIEDEDQDEPSTDQDIIKGLAMKTKELIGKLETLKTEHADGDGESYIELKGLENAKLPPKLERFLYSVANAEGMTKM